MKHRDREPSSRRTMRNMRRFQNRKQGEGWQAPKMLRKRAFISGTARQTVLLEPIPLSAALAMYRQDAGNEEVRRQSRPDDIT